MQTNDKKYTALSPEDKKAIVNRLARAIGHLEHVKMMVENDRDCTEVLVQLSAVKSAINNTGLTILQEYIDNCMEQAVKNGDTETVRELSKAIGMYCK